MLEGSEYLCIVVLDKHAYSVPHHVFFIVSPNSGDH